MKQTMERRVRLLERVSGPSRGGLVVVQPGESRENALARYPDVEDGPTTLFVWLGGYQQLEAGVTP